MSTSNCVSISMGPYGALHASGKQLATASTEGTSCMGPCGALHTYLLGRGCVVLAILSGWHQEPGMYVWPRVSFSMGPYGAHHASGNKLGTASSGGYLFNGPFWSLPYISPWLCFCYPAKTSCRIQNLQSGQKLRII